MSSPSGLGRPGAAEGPLGVQERAAGPEGGGGAVAGDGARKRFWRRSNGEVPGSIQHVYGAQHPPFDPLLHGTLLKGAPKAPATPVKAKSISTFPEFESNTSDAWDAGEDDDGLLAVAAESLNTDVVMETAHRVLRNHSQRQERRKPQEAPGPEQEPQPSAEPPSVPSGDLRLVKSLSESHTSCPAAPVTLLLCSGPSLSRTRWRPPWVARLTPAPSAAQR
ncbi:TBC1 domain family member 22A-like [Mirounga angustirostris]|uniref:TBC1 domain family member 22A-like n=1 Tax=Mirounga angustirostris TaxID=9716 RepID=UPI00313DEB1B